MEFEILLAREVTQAPRARVHAYYLAALHAQRRTQLRDNAQRRLQRQTAARDTFDGTPTFAAGIRRIIREVASKRRHVVEIC